MGRGLGRGPFRKSRIPASLFLSLPLPLYPPFCTAIILYYKLALFPDPGQHKHARKTQNHTHTHTGRWDAFFFPFSLRGASSVYIAASGGSGPGWKSMH